MKRYRYFVSRRNLRDNFYAACKIKEKFAWFPTYVDGKFILFKNYFTLYDLEAFRFGDRLDISYHPILKSFSIFSFKKYLKQEKIIKNLYRENIDQKKHSQDFWNWVDKNNIQS